MTTPAWPARGARHVSGKSLIHEGKKAENRGRGTGKRGVGGVSGKNPWQGLCGAETRKERTKRGRIGPERAAADLGSPPGAPGCRRRRKRAKWPRLDGAFSAVSDDSGPVQRRPRACRKRPCAARLSRRAGPETEHGKSSPGSPQIPVQDILYGVSLRRPGHGPPPRPRARHPAGPSGRPWGPRGTPRGLNDAPGPPGAGEPGAGVGRRREGAPRRPQRRRGGPARGPGFGPPI